jgi:hypothetical protein
LIGESAFENCTSLRTALIWGDITEIGKNAFKNCSSLDDISIPSSCKKIGESAFQNCTDMVSVLLPKHGEIDTMQRRPGAFEIKGFSAIEPIWGRTFLHYIIAVSLLIRTRGCIQSHGNKQSHDTKIESCDSSKKTCDCISGINLSGFSWACLPHVPPFKDWVGFVFKTPSREPTAANVKPNSEKAERHEISSV